mgnify:FL=1|jgi:hypothetical protein
MKRAVSVLLMLALTVLFLNVFVGCGDSTHRCRRRRHNMMTIKFLPTTFATYLNKIFLSYTAFRHFLFI